MASPASRKLPKKLIWISLISTFLSMQYGYNIWIVYSPTVLLQDFYNISTYEELMDPDSQTFMMSITIALFPLGAIFGALVFGYCADRKGTLLITNILSIVSAMLMGLSNKVQPFEFTMFARVYTGMCTGLVSCIIPLYLSEISQTSTRGSFVMMHHLLLTIGVVVARVLALRELLGTAEGWPILMSLGGIMPLFQLGMLPLLPESPRYLLIQKKKEEDAVEVLKNLRETEDVEEEIEEFHQEANFEKAEKKINTLKLLLRSPNLRWHVLTIVVLMLGQQVTGVNAAYYYTTRIYEAAKVGRDKVRFVTIATDTFVSFSTTLGVYLVDSVGRRTLLLVGFGICSVTCILLSITMTLQVCNSACCRLRNSVTLKWGPSIFYKYNSARFLQQDIYPFMTYINTVLDDVFLIGHAFGPYPVPPLIVAELFLQSSRSSGFVIAGVLQWFFHFITGVTFLRTENRLKGYIFLIFCPLCIGVFYYIFNFVPETKNMTFLDIRKLMAIQTAKRSKVKVHVDK
uniref:Solute carrier family 2, facilitated glucose transporter member 5-like n=1 Tax=Pogona vitticeps TaxID=103695 RepID=A0ABM5GDD4_9SAUR